MSRSNSIVKQASILALAGILVRIIGLLYRSPLTAMILDEGNGYYSTAYNIYALVLLISSYSIPVTLTVVLSPSALISLILISVNKSLKIAFLNLFVSSTKTLPYSSSVYWLNSFSIFSRSISDKTTVKVTGKQKDYSQVSFDQSELNTTAQQYVEEHQGELAKVYQEEGLSAYQIKVYDGIAPILYQSMTETYKSAPTEKLTATFTLEKKNDKWIITGIDE